MEYQSAPILTTERLTLRPFTPDGLDALAAIYADPVVMRYTSTGVRTREQTAANIAAYAEEWRTQGHGVWAVTETTAAARTTRSLGRCKRSADVTRRVL